MTKRRIPRLLQFALMVFGVYFGFILLFDVLLGQLIPRSLLTMYMVFVVSGALMAFTFTDEGAHELVAPIRALVEDPSKRRLRNIVFVIVPLLAGYYTYAGLQPGYEAPVELRTIHPAPPSKFKAYGKSYNLATLQNPLRRYQKEDSAKYRELVKAGGEVYIRNCQYCHGDKLDGKGPYAAGLNPTPINFRDVGTIAQLQESFLFWRIATGGPGLPAEAAPWISSMPVWENFLTEEEIWEVILFLYDYTGRQPRAWE
ncbi:c-type cytochrome [Candidatus Ferrigenium straubiae]|jgi:mono/diheme cytochrome c family protein|uniref:c-type cytochrome n=1 Tax=Candidatus Ferrigenium straubiae TaxID=2919506 RepID=UPI003F4ABB59